MLTLRQGLKVSAIVDKLGLKITNPNAPAEQVGADLLTQLVSKAHLAEREICALVADVRHIPVEEAGDVDLIAFFRDLVGDPAISRFFASAVKSRVQG